MHVHTKSLGSNDPESAPHALSAHETARPPIAGAPALALLASGTGASAARIAEIRQRVLTGAYSTQCIVDEVARRIVDCGDLWS